MGCVRLYVVSLLLLAVMPAGRVSAAHDSLEGPLVDLTGDLATDAASIAPWASSHADELHSCVISEPTTQLLGTVRAGAIILSRSAPSAEGSAKLLGSDDVVLADAHDLGFGTIVGPDITVLAPLTPALQLELRYFSTTGWNASETATEPGGVALSGFGLTGQLAGQSERFDYTSRLYSFEVNFRPRVTAGIPLVLGFRTLQLHERFEMWKVTPPPESLDLSTHANNFLYGFQIGAEPYLLGADKPLHLDGLLKAGIYGNHASQGTTSSFDADGVTAARNRAAFVGEIGLTIVYQFSQFFEARAGYELLWVNGVALAPDQSSRTDLLSSSATLNGSSTAFYQGAVASVGFVF